MKAEEIIEGLNQFLEKKRAFLKIEAKGFFVLQREIIPHPTFKAYKQYRNTLWYIKGSKRDKIIQVSATQKVVNTSSEEATLREVNIALYTKLIELEYTGIDAFIKEDTTWKCL